MNRNLDYVLNYMVKYTKDRFMQDSEPMLNHKDIEIVLKHIYELEQENKQLKEELENKIDLYEDTISYQLGFDKGKEYLQQRIDKAIEYIKSKHAIIDTDYIRIFDLFANRVEQGYINELLEILGDKENVKD